MRKTWLRSRPLWERRLALSAIVILVLLVGGLLTVLAVRNWHEGIIETNMSLSASAAKDLAGDAAEYLQSLPFSYDSEGRLVIAADRDSLDRQLTDLAAGVFSTLPGVKGGFWMLQDREFIGYANPWSPPPKPIFGPPPRTYALILSQIMETVDTGQPLVRLHQIESVSVATSVFPLATEPVQIGGELVGVAWARIHIERDLPAQRLTRYLGISAIIIVIAFLAVLLTLLYQRREIGRLNRGLQLIGGDPSHRMAPRRGMFGTISEAINTMVQSLETENRRRRQLELELHQQDKMAALGKLLAGVAHELKTPLAILKTRVQIWQRDLAKFAETSGQAPPFSDESMQIVLHEIDRLSGLLRKLLYFSRPARREVMRRLEADDLIRHTVVFVKPQLEKKQIDLRMELTAPEATILGDPDALHQVFLNILTNSVEIVDEGGSLYVATQAEGEAGRLVIDVEDSGPGIAPELREQVLTPFYTTREGGAGLGLAIAYEIVRAHGGTIEFIDAEHLKGAHCRVRLPLYRDEQDGT
jgi:signal transduction histidine kinase